MRFLETLIHRDLEKKMVFVGGPRQVGKTTLAKHLLADHGPGRYFDWDHDEDRQSILRKQWARADRLLVFDELHKFPQWKRWVKGLYDVAGDRHRILVTGSARLDVYRQGGDSLLGRYHYWRLHPFSLDEIPAGIDPPEALRRLMTLGGFPEPFLADDEREARRWRKDRFDRVLQEDIRDLENIRNIQGLRLFVDLLRERVGNLVVLANLARDIEVAPQTAKTWLDALERMYLLFRVMPYTQDLPRAIQKPPKVYFFDNADVPDATGPRFENLVASHLLKRLHLIEDRDGHRCELRYLRDKEGREVDFAILQDGLLKELIEVKYADESISPSLRYYAERLQPERATQIVATVQHPWDRDGIHVTSPLHYFAA
jgi:predicted AAA+ superfamily ATPase